MSEKNKDDLENIRKLRKKAADAGGITGYFLPGIAFGLFCTLIAPAFYMGLLLGFTSAFLFYTADLLLRSIIIQPYLPSTVIRNRFPKMRETGTPLEAFGRSLAVGVLWASPLGLVIKTPQKIFEGMQNAIKRFIRPPAPGRVSPLQKLFTDPDKKTVTEPAKRSRLRIQENSTPAAAETVHRSAVRTISAGETPSP